MEDMEEDVYFLRFVKCRVTFNMSLVIYALDIAITQQNWDDEDGFGCFCMLQAHWLIVVVLSGVGQVLKIQSD